MAFGQMVLTLKAIMVFKSEWVSHWSDEKLLWVYRLGSVGYTVALGTLGIIQTQFLIEPRNAIILELMTGLKEPT